MGKGCSVYTITIILKDGSEHPERSFDKKLCRSNKMPLVNKVYN